MDPIFGLGIIGGIVTALGAFWAAKPTKHPARSLKNWLLAIGGTLLFLFALLDFLYGTGSLFFVILESLVIISCGLMMLNTCDKTDAWILAISGLGLVIWSLFLFENFSNIFFIIGLVAIGIGYALDTGTLKRNIALALGGLLVAIFSFLGASWIFFWLNIFFAIFSGFHVWRILKKR
ncbi:hypothetical protein HN954_02270 [bacterium]|jgi:hypothetical protein|nr:hypothetical protein [bacterium]MBT6831550.1 hypothetical protein [bacterium]MBT6996231.1 hypothetical protein [bacterium]MBT7772272.1 hypothetical protein [bacterium]